MGGVFAKEPISHTLDTAMKQRKRACFLSVQNYEILLVLACTVRVLKRNAKVYIYSCVYLCVFLSRPSICPRYAQVAKSYKPGASNIKDVYV